MWYSIFEGRNHGFACADLRCMRAIGAGDSVEGGRVRMDNRYSLHQILHPFLRLVPPEISGQSQFCGNRVEQHDWKEVVDRLLGLLGGHHTLPLTSIIQSYQKRQCRLHLAPATLLALASALRIQIHMGSDISISEFNVWRGWIICWT